MSRSRKRTPIAGVCHCHSAKPYKRMASRRFRRIDRDSIKHTGEPRMYVVMPSVIELAYDGKRFLVDADDSLMRK